MERTEYTPKRLLSLLLALIMLLGMFPTAALAAEPAGGIVLNSDEYKAHGLIFKFEPILPDGPYIMGESKTFGFIIRLVPQPATIMLKSRN